MKKQHKKEIRTDNSLGLGLEIGMETGGGLHPGDDLLMETGDFLLLETGDSILLEA